MVSELRHSIIQEKSWRELLKKAFDALPEGPHRQIVTIKGIGEQTVAALVATAVDVSRFETANHLRVQVPTERSTSKNQAEITSGKQRLRAKRESQVTQDRLLMN
ncbi:MAG: IS110 family transposase [Planctomycetes bacterium]|nr:IS110 family transposase [Planctomycetota bacterium]